MLTRFHHILIALLVAQIAAAALILTREDDAAAAQARPLLASFDAAKVTRVQVTPATGAPVDLVKRGDAWVVASSHDYPVTASKVTDLLASVAKLNAAAPIATSATRHKQLRVADDTFERKLTLTVDGKDTTLYVGGAAGARRNALRIGSDARVFAVSGLTPWSVGATAREWIEQAYVRVPKDEIAKLSVQRGGTTIELARGKAGDAWTATLDGKPLAPAAGESLDTAAIDSVLATAASIDVAEPADPKKAATPTATITIERLSTDASVAPIVLDVVEEGPNYWVRQRGHERAVVVDKASLDPVVTLERSKLVKTAPPSTPPGKPAQSAAKSG